MTRILTQFQLADRTQPVARRLLVSELSHVVRFRRGRVDKVLEPGLHRMRPKIDRVRAFPVAEEVMIVPGQEMLTSDGATVRATVSVVTKVHDAVRLARRGNYHDPLYLQVQLALRAAIAGRTLEALLDERAELDAELNGALTDFLDELGLVLHNAAVRDLVVPGELKRALTEVLTAKLSGQAMLERARGETAALRGLANAARIAEQSPTLIQLRLLQQMETTTGNTYMVDTKNVG